MTIHKNRSSAQPDAPALDTEPPEATVPAHQEPTRADTDHNPNARAETIAYVYTGNGTRWLEGIPARDLTNGELRQLSKADRARVRASDLYQKPPQTDAKDT